MIRDTSSSFANKAPDAIKLELEQPFTMMLTLDPVVLFPIVKPPMVMKNGDDALIAPPEMLKITQLEFVRLLVTETGATLLEPAVINGWKDGRKKKSGYLKVIKLHRDI
jgi:hypothetical protein